jgi:hypothetical protein
MIAICPSCHDQVHHGVLRISDETLRSWKGIARSKIPTSAQIYVEPSSKLQLRIGAIAVLANREEVRLFKLSEANHLSLRVLDKDVLQVNASLKDQNGKEILRVVENIVRVADDTEVLFDYQAGHARITVPASEKYVPYWLLRQMARVDRSFVTDGRLIALDVGVVAPGDVKIQGCWCEEDLATIATNDFLYFCESHWVKPFCIGACGEGEPPIVKLADDAPITTQVLWSDYRPREQRPTTPNYQHKDATKIAAPFATQFLANKKEIHMTIGSPEVIVDFEDGSNLTFLMVGGNPELQALGTRGGFAEGFIRNVKSYAFLKTGVGFLFRDSSKFELDFGDSLKTTQSS